MGYHLLVSSLKSAQQAPGTLAAAHFNTIIFYAVQTRAMIVCFSTLAESLHSAATAAFVMAQTR
jgi:hypothetical protein